MWQGREQGGQLKDSLEGPGNLLRAHGRGPEGWGALEGPRGGLEGVRVALEVLWAFRVHGSYSQS